jgi:hypothetical protein
MNIKLTLADFTTNKEVSNKEWQEIQSQSFIEMQNNFKRFGVKCKAVKCKFTNDKGTFDVYYIKDVYDKIKHLKCIKYVNELNIITTQYDNLPNWLKLAEATKNKLKFNLDLCEDKFIKL